MVVGDEDWRREAGTDDAAEVVTHGEVQADKKSISSRELNERDLDAEEQLTRTRLSRCDACSSK